MPNEVCNVDCLTLFKRLAELSISFDLCYADMMFAERTPEQLLWIKELRSIANPQATVYVHTDQRSVCEVRAALLEHGWYLQAWLIWGYNWGGRPRNMWAHKHDDILVATAHPKKWTFNPKAVAIPKKTLINSSKDWQIPTDVWQDIGIVHTMSKEKWEGEHRVWQKPRALLERIIKASSNAGDLVLDPYAGTGTTLVVAKKLARRFVGCDIDPEAVRISNNRLQAVSDFPD